MKTFSTTEASKILNVSRRAIQKRCKASKIWRKNNKYQITQDHIDNWEKEIVYKRSSRNKQKLEIYKAWLHDEVKQRKKFWRWKRIYIYR